MPTSPAPQPPCDRTAVGRAWLAARDPAMALIHARLADLPWRDQAGGFAGLLRLITAQQVSTASAAAIWGRIEAGLGEVTAQAVLAREAEGLKAFGLSRPKIRYALALAEAHGRGEVDFDSLAGLDDEAAIAVLTRLVGVGRWTAEIYLMFCEGRMDVFPAGDLALQEGLRLAEDGAVRPDERALRARAQAWRPYRSVAAHMIWAYYLAALGRPDIPVEAT